MSDPEPAAEPTTPAVPPPDLPKYSPPAPTLADAPVITPPAVPTPEEARRIHLKVAKEEEDPSTANGAPAPFNTRFLAALIDMVLMIGMQVAIIMLMPSFIEGKLAFLVSVGYLLTRDCLPVLGGQSIGKKAMNIIALTSDGQSLAGNWQPGLVRNAVLLIPMFPLVEIFVLLTRDDKPQRGCRLGDEWAKTKVVIHRPETPPAA